MTKTIAATAAMAAVEAAGWKRNPGGNPNAVAKYFDSAVGIKMALIWISGHADQVGNFRVTGEYWSEGRNVAEGIGVILNINTPIEKIAGLIDGFLQNLERQIKDSYAVRLLES